MLVNLKKFIFTLNVVALVINAPVHAQTKSNATLKRYSAIISSPYVTWGLRHDLDSSINVVPAWKILKVKEEVKVAVVDTGVDPHHPLVAGNMISPKSNQGERRPTAQSYGVDFSKGSSNKFAPFDENGHGTHISGIIKSVFPDVKMLALKYYNPKASGYDNLVSTLAALKHAVDSNVDIINYSGGGPEPSIEEFRILKDAERKGILVVAAAGNNRSNIDNKKNAYYPASYNLNNIITVTAHDQNLKLLSSSNYGAQKVHIAAPGHKIASALPMGRYGYLTGTSQATAFVSGVAAMMKSMFPEITPQEIKNYILRTARVEKSLRGKCATSGRIDAGEALKNLILERGNEKEQNSTIAKKKEKRSLAQKAKKKSKKKDSPKLKIVKIKNGKIIVRTPKKSYRKTLFNKKKKESKGKIIYRL